MKSIPKAIAAASILLPGWLHADHVILDDCIIDGSMAVGLDAVNGENFGFDTIRIKENNLRFHFDDTSIAASFPRNDWRFIANDSANGGDSYLGIEDSTAGRVPFRVEAGAANHSLFVESSGDVGFGTNNPVVRMHSADGDTPTLRLEQNGSSGWNPQTWDVAGNETNFFIRDVTHGSKLPFRIRPDAPTSSIEIEADGNVQIPNSLQLGSTNLGGGNRLHVTNTAISNANDVVITDTGEVGIGTTMIDPLAKLQIMHQIPQPLRLESTLSGSPTNYIAWYDTDGRTGLLGHHTASNDELWFGNEAGGDLVISANYPARHLEIDSATGNVTATGTVSGMSDRNQKKEVVPINAAELLEKVIDLPISEWSYKTDTDIRHVGPMAQDFRASFGLGKNDKTISFHDPAGVALAAIQGLHDVVQEKETRIEQLEQQNKALEDRLRRIEEALQLKLGGGGNAPIK